MTNEEAIKTIETAIVEVEWDYPMNYSVAFEMAISALEKQIPKKPIKINKNSVFDGNWKKICPYCGAKLMERITTENESYPIHYNMTKHCMCGQTLDWGDQPTKKGGEKE